MVDTIKHMFQDFVVIDNKIWFSSSVMNGIFCADVDGGHAAFVAVFPGSSLFQRRLYTEVYAYGDELIFIPYMAEKISVYNMSKDVFIQLETPHSRMQRRTRAYVSAQWKNKILLFHDYVSELTILNTDDYTIRKIPLPITKEIFRFARINCIINNCLYEVVSNMLIIVQLDCDKLTVKKIAPNEVQMVGIRFDGKRFWIIDRKNQLYKFQLGEEKIQKVLKLLQLQEEQIFFRFRDIFILDNEAFFFAQEVNHIIRLNLISMNKEFIPLEMHGGERANMYLYAHLDKKRNEIRILSDGEDRHCILDMDINSWRTIYYETPIKEVNGMLQGYGELKPETYDETSQGKGLESIMLYLTLQKEGNATEVQNNCGKEIYQHILRINY